ncbi:MAG TPA: GNAT family N-acetyltransferase [Allosphingosinicella sp.]|uniref:GNAT family N-acetyltransferase n=1 Tax=Allosphingosinicella sp. TaxID=2823234 RepID=UPI002ED97957
MMTEVRNNEDETRYELETDAGLALAAYAPKNGIVSFTHTEVPQALEGQGIGSRLIKGALDDVRSRGLKVRPLCSFVRSYMERHPETHDLLAEPLG